jgi:hypothetical protein
VRAVVAMIDLLFPLFFGILTIPVLLAWLAMNPPKPIRLRRKPPDPIVEMRESRARYVASQHALMELWEDMFDPERHERERQERLARGATHYPYHPFNVVYDQYPSPMMPPMPPPGGMMPPSAFEAYVQEMYSSAYSHPNADPFNGSIPASYHVRQAKYADARQSRPRRRSMN